MKFPIYSWDIVKFVAVYMVDLDHDNGLSKTFCDVNWFASDEKHLLLNRCRS